MIKFFDTNTFVKDNEKQGSIPSFFKVSKDVMNIVWASALESFLVALVIIFDGIQVASIKLDDPTLANFASAAVTLTKQPYFLMIAFINSLNVVISAIIARRKGEQDVESANKTTHLAIFLSTITSLILPIIMLLLAKPICMLMGGEDGTTLDFAVKYFSILCQGFLFNGLRLTINAIQKGMGKTKISMISNLIANGVNVFGNYLLINGNLSFPRLGIEGAAIATVIGNFVAFLISLISLIREKDYIKFSLNKFFNIKFYLNKETVKPIKQLIPSVLIEQIFLRIGFMVFSILIGGLGSDNIYVHGVCNDINSLLFTIADGFSIGTAAIVGHRLGEKRKDLAIVYAKVAMRISVFTALIVCSFMLIFRKFLVSLYNPDSEEKMIKACNILLIAAAGTVFQNIQWVITGILRSAGDTKFTATTSLVSVVIIRPLLTLLFAYGIPVLGLYGAWIAHLIDMLIRMVLNLIRFNSRKWINIKL